jgi:hypothetical protein
MALPGPAEVVLLAGRYGVTADIGYTSRQELLRNPAANLKIVDNLAGHAVDDRRR